MTTTDTRTNYTAGLRALADLLDNNPDLPLPYHGNDTHLLWVQDNGDNDETRDTARLFARLIPGTISKKARDTYLDLDGHIAGLKVSLITSRAAVCERVVTGTHEVTTPARPALNLPAEPEHTETIEDVEWVCGPLLADSVPA